MLHWKDFSAWVMIDGKEAAEYDVQTSEEEKTVTCWIASELGKKFSIWWRNSPSFPQDVVGYVHVDGNSCGGAVLYRTASLRTVQENGMTDGITMKPFMFSSLALTDDDAFLGISSHENLGLLELTITPIVVLQLNAHPTLRSLSELKVHEQSKKAVTQQVALGEAELVAQPQETLDLQRAGPDVVKFCFKYRPIDLLRANGIAPSLKRKASAECPRAQNSDDSTELAEEAKNPRNKLRAVEGKLQKQEKKLVIKAEPGAVIDLTQEGSQSKRAKLKAKRPARFVSGEVIDLT